MPIKSVYCQPIVNGDTSQAVRIELSGRGKRVWLDERPVDKISRYIASFYSFLFHADGLYNYGRLSSAWRTFFDRYVSFVYPSYLRTEKDTHVVISYGNKLVKSSDISNLDEWNKLLIQKGYAIMTARHEMNKKVNGILPRIFRVISGREEPFKSGTAPLSEVMKGIGPKN